MNTDKNEGSRQSFQVFSGNNFLWARHVFRRIYNLNCCFIIILISLADSCLGCQPLGERERQLLADAWKEDGRHGVRHSYSVSPGSITLPCCTWYSSCNIWSNRTRMCLPGSLFYPIHMIQMLSSHDALNLLREYMYILLFPFYTNRFQKIL